MRAATRPLHPCAVCDAPTRATTCCRSCTVQHILYFARRELEREGVLERHGNNLTNVYSDPLVVARARRMAGREAVTA